MQLTAKIKGLVAVAAIAIAVAAPAQADQVGSFIQLTATPTFTFTNLGTSGGSIVGSNIQPGLYVDAIGSGVYSASTSVNLQYVSGNTYSGAYSIIATATNGPIATGDVLFSASYTATLTGGVGSLSLNNVLTTNIVSSLYSSITFTNLVTGFTFTNILGDVAAPSLPPTGSGSGNGVISISANLAAVPEPASMVLLGLGMLVPIALLARRNA